MILKTFLYIVILLRPLTEIFGQSSIFVVGNFYVTANVIMSIIIIVVFWVTFIDKLVTKKVIFDEVIVLFCIFIIYTFLTGVIIVNDRNKLLETEFRLFTIAALYWICVNLSEKVYFQKNIEKQILFVIVLSSAIPVCYGALDYLFFSGGSSEMGVSRLLSFFVNPVAFSRYLAVIGVAMVGYFLINVKNEVKIKLYFLIYLLVFGYTYGKAGWLGFSMGTLFLLFNTVSAKKTIVYTLGIFILLSVVIVSLPEIEQYVYRISETRDIHSSSMASRMLIWRNLITRFVDSPLIGYGLGSAEANATAWAGLRTLPHNEYLRLLTDTGILGFTIYILIYIEVFRKQIKLTKIKYTTYSARCLAFTNMAMIICFLTIWIFGNVLENLIINYVIWIPVGVSVGKGYCIKRRDRKFIGNIYRLGNT